MNKKFSLLIIALIVFSMATSFCVSAKDDCETGLVTKYPINNTISSATANNVSSGDNFEPSMVPITTQKSSSKTTTKASSKVTVKKVKLTKVAKGKKSFKATWKKLSGVTGYQLQYSTKSNFKSKKTVRIKGAKNVSKKIKGLKKKKKYFVRVRAYKTVNGKTTYGKWSDKKSVKTK